MIESGIPVWKAEFQSAVNNSDQVPENYFSSESNVKSRNVRMWLTAGGNILLCLHKGKYFFVPAADIKFGNFE